MRSCLFTSISVGITWSIEILAISTSSLGQISIMVAVRVGDRRRERDRACERADGIVTRTHRLRHRSTVAVRTVDNRSSTQQKYLQLA